MQRLNFLLTVMLALLVGGRPASAVDAAFVESIDLAPLAEVAVHREGRISSLHSHARAIVRLISGPRMYNDQSHLFTYLDLMFRPGAYDDADIIYVKNKVLRSEIRAAALASFDERLSAPRMRATLEARMDQMVKDGLVSEARLLDQHVHRVLSEKRSDLIRSAKFVEMLDTAIGVSEPSFLARTLRIVPPPVGGRHDMWLTVEQFTTGGMTADDEDPAITARRVELGSMWSMLRQSWTTGDADRINQAIVGMAELLPNVNSDLYPQSHRAGWPWSFAAAPGVDDNNNAAGWITVVALIGVLLASAFVGTNRAWRSAAIVLAVMVAALQVGALGLGQQSTLGLESWYIRSYNMTWVWMVYLLSVIFLLLGVVYRWPKATWIGVGVFLIAFGLHSFATLLRWYVSDRWPNSNMFEAITTAAWFGGCFAVPLEIALRRTAMRGLFTLTSAVASMIALMSTFFLPLALNADISNRMPVLHDIWLYIHTNVIIFSYCLIFMAAVTATVYMLYRLGGGSRDFARVGGAGSLIVKRSDGTDQMADGQATVGQILDGTTMVLMELSFILLWAGLVMGAIWADHSWGRPWGWDPKEVFALNTFLVFAILIHVRMKTRDKGMWTAVIALIGAGVMLFNWVFVNFFIVGLHSYA